MKRRIPPLKRRKRRVRYTEFRVIWCLDNLPRTVRVDLRRLSFMREIPSPDIHGVVASLHYDYRHGEETYGHGMFHRITKVVTRIVIEVLAERPNSGFMTVKLIADVNPRIETETFDPYTQCRTGISEYSLSTSALT